MPVIDGLSGPTWCRAPRKTGVFSIGSTCCWAGDDLVGLRGSLRAWRNNCEATEYGGYGEFSDVHKMALLSSHLSLQHLQGISQFIDRIRGSKEGELGSAP
jgi:hypothetical protein